MKLYYFKADAGNFGDDLNPWLWQRLIPEILDEDDRTLFVGIGTLLNHRIPVTPNKLVFGSGAGYGDIIIPDSRWEFYCVRGPLTAKLLGLDKRLAITDAAALVAREISPSSEIRSLVSYMPHYTSIKKADWENICKAAGLHYIDPTAPVEEILRDINRSKFLVAEAMHGAIVADALRVPWIPVLSYSNLNKFKWQDWCSSLQMEYKPFVMPEVWDAERNLDLISRLKNQVKRGSMKLVTGSNWTHPPPPKSPASFFDSVIHKLGEISNIENAAMSSDYQFNTAFGRLQEQLHKLRNSNIK
jgi:succinoglycan biosynthesis protein ExoV